MKRAINAVFFLVVSGAACAGHPVSEPPASPTMKFEVISSLPIQDIWNLTAPKVISSGEAVVDYRAYDPEDRPARDRMSGCGIAMLGTGDLGIAPLALRIWSSKSCHIEIKASSKPGSGGQFAIVEDNQNQATIVVGDQYDVSVDGKHLGKIGMPK